MKRKTGAAQEKRYQKLLSDPKHRQRKPKEKGRYDKYLNLLILVGLVYGGIYLVPAKDKEDFAKLLDELPAEISGAAVKPGGQSGAETQTASLSAVLASFIPDIPTPPSPSEPRDTASAAADEEDDDPEPARPSGFVGQVLSMNDFPRAHDNWERTEFVTAEAAATALQRMDRFLDTLPIAMAPVERLSDRKAALYQDGANLRFLILVEADRPATGTQIVTAAAGPAPSVMIDMPSAMSEPRPEMSVSDAPSGRRIARARIKRAGRRSVELAGIGFIDHAEDPAQNLVDLRARLPYDRSIYIRGRAPLTVIEDFLSRANLRGLGVRS